MPLYRGEENLGRNYKKLVAEGYSKKQATAIAIKVAGRNKRKKKQEKKRG
jgi:hypothetical protein